MANLYRLSLLLLSFGTMTALLPVAECNVELRYEPWKSLYSEGLSLNDYFETAGLTMVKKSYFSPQAARKIESNGLQAKNGLCSIGVESSYFVKSQKYDEILNISEKVPKTY